MEEIDLKNQNEINPLQDNEKLKKDLIRKRKSTFQIYGRTFLEYMKEFCETSSIQGLSYLIKDKTLFGRIWWTIVLVLGAIGSYYMVYKIIDKWVTTPVMVTYGVKELSISEVPFPAVTICPESKITYKCLNYTDVLKERRTGDIFDILNNIEENIVFDFMALSCKPENHESTLSIFNKKLETNETIFDESDEDSEETAYEDYSNFFYDCAAVTLDDAICQWMGEIKNCKDIMTPIMTDEGLCYSFNMFDEKDIYSDLNTMTYYNTGISHADWDPEEGYPKDSDDVEKMYPRRSFLNGAKNSFDVIFFTRKLDINYACQDFSTQGIRISLHSPTSIPRPSQVFYTSGLNRVTFLAVVPSMSTTSKVIENYPPDKRNCYFGYERNLKFFKFYSQTNCNLECWANYTLSQCGCVNYYMPRDNKTKACVVKQRFCLEKAKQNYSVDILKERLNSKTENLKTNCHCLPLCSDISYQAEISTSIWDFDDPDNVDFDIIRDLLPGVHASAARIYFKNPYFLPVHKDELYGINDMVSNIGGVIGLITGFSLFSLGEIIYFLSIKLMVNYWKFGYWGGLRTFR